MRKYGFGGKPAKLASSIVSVWKSETLIKHRFHRSFALLLLFFFLLCFNVFSSLILVMVRRPWYSLNVKINLHYAISNCPTCATCSLLQTVFGTRHVNETEAEMKKSEKQCKDADDGYELFDSEGLSSLDLLHIVCCAAMRWDRHIHRSTNLIRHCTEYHYFDNIFCFRELTNASIYCRQFYELSYSRRAVKDVFSDTIQMAYGHKWWLANDSRRWIEHVQTYAPRHEHIINFRINSFMIPAPALNTKIKSNDWRIATLAMNQHRRKKKTKKSFVFKNAKMKIAARFQSYYLTGVRALAREQAYIQTDARTKMNKIINLVRLTHFFAVVVFVFFFRFFSSMCRSCAFGCVFMGLLNVREFPVAIGFAPQKMNAKYRRKDKTPKLSERNAQCEPSIIISCKYLLGCERNTR